MKILIKTLLIASLPFGASVIAAKADGCDPRQPCHIILENADQAYFGDGRGMDLWLFGINAI